jgi:hypothetical protein
MTESNGTSLQQTHRIFISSPKPSTDRTGLYILSLLLSLLLILVSYLLYNFISYRRYTRSRKKKDYLEQQLNDRLLIILNQPFESEAVPAAHSTDEQPVPGPMPSLPAADRNSVSHQNYISNRLVSDL